MSRLNQAANRLARRIVTALGTSNEPVAILMNQGAGMIIAILGVLKAGKSTSRLILQTPPKASNPFYWIVSLSA
jgi:non-ribosomal peptide synthetase component F